MPDDAITDKICFKARIDIELLICMFVLNDWENTALLIESKKVLVEDRFVEMLSAMHKKIPNYLRQELQYFFSNPEIAWGFIAYEYKQENITSAPEMIENIKTQDGVDILSNIVEPYLYLNVSDEQAWLSAHDVHNDIDDMLAIVKKADVQNLSLKQKIIEILENHSEIKQRLCLLISSFYNKVFEPEKEKIMSLLTQGREKYQTLFDRNPESFIRFYMKTDLDSITEKFVMHVSYFLAAGNLTINPGYWKSTCAVFGIFNDINMVHENNMQKETVQKLYKILADNTRFDIICALMEKSYYNQELAEKFGVSPSTINHHIGSMIGLGIVSFQKNEHRIYYVLKEDILKNLLDQGTQIILRKI